MTESAIGDSTSGPRAVFRDLIRGDRIIVCPGVNDPFVARLAEGAGFEMLFSSGAGIANWTLGLPDLGLATMVEILDATHRIADAVQIGRAHV